MEFTIDFIQKTRATLVHNSPDGRGFYVSFIYNPFDSMSG
jgi:hypothetical protein